MPEFKFENSHYLVIKFYGIEGAKFKCEIFLKTVQVLQS